MSDLLNGLCHDIELTYKLSCLVDSQLNCPETAEGIAEFHRLQEEIDNLKLLHKTEREIND